MKNDILRAFEVKILRTKSEDSSLLEKQINEALRQDFDLWGNIMFIEGYFVQNMIKKKNPERIAYLSDPYKY